MAKMGEHVKCKITGFQGTITGITEYIDGSKNVRIANENNPTGVWMEASRVKATNMSDFEIKEQGGNV